MYVSCMYVCVRSSLTYYRLFLIRSKLASYIYIHPLFFSVFDGYRHSFKKRLHISSNKCLSDLNMCFHPYRNLAYLPLRSKPTHCLLHPSLLLYVFLYRYPSTSSTILFLDWILLCFMTH